MPDSSPNSRKARTTPKAGACLAAPYQSMGKFGESRDALKRAWQLMPDNHDLTVEYAQALALSTEGRCIAGEPRQLIEDVLKGRSGSPARALADRHQRLSGR